jgi:hypothetical protein
VILSFNLVLALFLIAPGFGVYGGVFIPSRNSRFYISPPAPNSILTLAVVSLGALCAHAIWASVLAVQDVACTRLPCLRLPIDPDTYSAAMAAAEGHHGVSQGVVALFLVTCFLLTLASFAATRLIILSGLTERFAVTAYGWQAGLVEQTSAPGRYVTAFVVTDMQKDGAFLGYEGLLEAMNLDTDEQIKTIVLLYCNAFLLHIGKTVRRTPIPREGAIPRLLIEGRHIQNVAFNVFEWEQD